MRKLANVAGNRLARQGCREVNMDNQVAGPDGSDSSTGLGPAWRLRAWIGERMQGGCRVLSQGSACQCPLCDLDRMRDALQWYASEADAIARNVVAQHTQAMMASMQVLALDGGKRARDVGA